MPYTPGLGIQVLRAAAADDQNVATNIFAITGGFVLITSLIGVRTVIQAGGASNLQYSHSVGPTNLCAVAAVTGNAVNTVYFLTGDTTDPVQIGAAGVPVAGGRVVATSTTYGGNARCDMIMFTGFIRHLHSAAAGTGSTRYILHYIPLDDGAAVAAA